MGVICNFNYSIPLLYLSFITLYYCTPSPDYTPRRLYSSAHSIGPHPKDFKIFLVHSGYHTLFTDMICNIVYWSDYCSCKCIITVSVRGWPRTAVTGPFQQ